MKRTDWLLVSFLATILVPVAVYFLSESGREPAVCEAAVCCCKMAHCWCGHPPSKGDR